MTEVIEIGERVIINTTVLADPALAESWRSELAAMCERINGLRRDLRQQLEAGSGRYQTINRYLLQALYGTVLAKMEPVKKAGVIYRSDDQGESWK